MAWSPNQCWIISDSSRMGMVSIAEAQNRRRKSAIIALMIVVHVAGVLGLGMPVSRGGGDLGLDGPVLDAGASMVRMLVVPVSHWSGLLLSARWASRFGTRPQFDHSSWPRNQVL